ITNVREPVLLHAGEVRVPGPRKGDRLRPLPLGLTVGPPGAHPPRPVLVVAIADDERERRAERAPVAKAGEHLDLIGLDLLPRGPAVPLLATAEISVDRILVEHEPRGQAGDDRNESRPVRFAGRCQLQTHARERSGLEPGEYARDKAPLPVPRRGEEKAAEPTRLLGVERDRGLRRLTTPHAQTRMLRPRQVDGHAEAAVADVGVPAEVLDDLRPLRLAAVRTEAKLVLHSHPACLAAPHRAR